MDLKSLQPNQPQSNLSDYTILCYGRPKGGKTSLFYELAKKKYNGDMSKSLLLGFEKGYKALNSIMAVDVNKYEDFLEIVEQLVEDREELTYEWLGLDTLDVLYSYCVEYVVRKERIARKDSKIKTISDIPWGQGWALVKEQLERDIGKLINAGYGLFMISHDVDKQMTSRDGTKYDKTTVALPTKAREVFVNIADFIIFIEITKEQQGDKVIDNRQIILRSDGDIEAGSRFQKVPDKIEYDAAKFLEVFEDAVLASYDDDEEAVAIAKEEQALEREQKAKEFVNKEKQKISIEEMIEKITENIKSLAKEGQAEVKKIFKENFGSHNYKKFEADQLEKAVVLINEVQVVEKTNE